MNAQGSLTKDQRPVSCLNGHPVYMYASRLTARPGLVYMWGYPLTCEKCAALCKA
jgi:hypothetical protein